MGLLDPTDMCARLFVYTVAVSSIAMTWLTLLLTFRFARSRDVGVTGYLFLVSAWFALRLPPTVFAPVFFADPAGAVVGKACSNFLPQFNRRWYGGKTICGTAAVFALTWATIGFPCSQL